MMPNRRPKWFRLKRNHGCETPGSLLFLDTESHKESPHDNAKWWTLRFRLCCLTYVRYERGKVSRRDTLDTTDWMEAWNFIDSKQQKGRPLWVFGHNLGFDLTMLRFWELLQLRRYRLSLDRPVTNSGEGGTKKGWRGKCVIGGFPFYLFCMGTRGMVKFVDTMNYYPRSLDSLGTSLGLPKKPFPGFDAPEAEMSAYCRNDVDIVEKLMLKTLDCWREADGGVFQPTAAMLALTSFRHKLPRNTNLGTESSIVYDGRDEWQKLEREAYYGGQVTCFYLGPVLPVGDPAGDVGNKPRLEDYNRPTGPLYLLDVRSLYPAVMGANRFPFRRLYKRKEVPPSELLRTMSAYGAIARVFIKSPEEEFTLRTEDGQLQATGRFETVLAGPELKRALKGGYVTRVVEVQFYCMDALFSDWVKGWTKTRNEADRIGDPMRAEYAKLILNSLSGKLSQTGRHWVERPERIPPFDFGTWVELDAREGTRRRFRAIGGNTQEQVDGEPPWYTFPAISAYVTAFGRERMRQLRSLCPARTVLYQSTDSLLVTSEGYFALLDAGEVREKELGYLQLKEVGEYGEVLGCNHYRIGERFVRSGSWGRAVRQPDGRYTYQSFESVASVVATQPDGTVRVDERELTRVGTYQKGQADANGWVTWPRLGDDWVPPEIDLPLFAPRKDREESFE